MFSFPDSQITLGSTASMIYAIARTSAVCWALRSAATSSAILSPAYTSTLSVRIPQTWIYVIDLDKFRPFTVTHRTSAFGVRFHPSERMSVIHNGVFAMLVFSARLWLRVDTQGIHSIRSEMLRVMFAVKFLE